MDIHKRISLNDIFIKTTPQSNEIYTIDRLLTCEFGVGYETDFQDNTLARAMTSHVLNFVLNLVLRPIIKVQPKKQTLKFIL